jgi:hypothetical protein
MSEDFSGHSREPKNITRHVDNIACEMQQYQDSEVVKATLLKASPCGSGKKQNMCPPVKPLQTKSLTTPPTIPIPGKNAGIVVEGRVLYF